MQKFEEMNEVELQEVNGGSLQFDRAVEEASKETNPIAKLVKFIVIVS